MAGGGKTSTTKHTKEKKSQLHVREAKFEKNVLDQYHKIKDLQ